MFLPRVVATIVFISLLVIRCNMVSSESPDELAGGNGSGVGTGFVSGLLYEPDGITPANGALLVVRYKNTTAPVISSGIGKTREALHSALTNKNGVFSFDTIADGLYVIEGTDNRGNMVLYDSIAITGSINALTLHDDTLEPAGVITGTISLVEDGNHSQVFILAFGVDRFSQVESHGTFTFPQFAAGIYTLKIISLDPTYETVDTANIIVTSGDTTDIGTIVLPRRYIQPVPQNVNIDYDTMLMEATISWHPTPDSVTAGYNIYRSFIGITLQDDPVRLNREQLCRDTVYSDRTIWEDAYLYSADDSIQYIITMIDSSGNESRGSTPFIIPITDKWEIVDSGQFDLPSSDVIGSLLPHNDEIICLGKSLNERDQPAKQAIYRFSSDGVLTRSIEFPQPVEGYFSSFIKIAPSDDVWLLFKLKDDASETDYDSASIYRLSPSHELTQIARIDKKPEDPPINTDGMIINNRLYYSNGWRIIQRIDLETGQNSVFLNLLTENTRIYGFSPSFDGGFVISVITLNPLANECRYYDSDGNAVRTVNVPVIKDDLGFDNKRYLLAADDTTLYFENYLYRMQSDSSAAIRRMPSHRFSEPLFINEDGTVIRRPTSSVLTRSPSLLISYRPKR